MNNFLKGNFEVKNPVVEKKAKFEKNLSGQLRKRALANICGSMVYVDQSELTWDGDAEPTTKE